MAKHKDMKEKGPRRKRQPRGRRRKEEILKAACSVFSRHPYPAASMRMIAREAGVDYHVILYYFPTKADLFRAVLKELLDALLQTMPTWFQGLGGLSVPQAISTYLGHSLEFHSKNPALYNIILLNMAQSVSKPTLVPGSEEIRRTIDRGRTIFGALSRFDIRPQQLDFLSTAGFLLLITLIGGRQYHAEKRGMDPESDAYRIWVKELIMFILLPVLNTLELKEATDANDARSEQSCPY